MIWSMDFWQKTNWFAVQSKPHQEKLAAAKVATFDVEVFLPKTRQERLVCGVSRLVTRPLFPAYFFARLCPLLSLDAVRNCQGVLRLVGTKHSPLPIEAELIASIRDRVHADGFVRLETRSLLAGDRVTVEQGPFAGWIGKVEREWDDGRRVSILLEAIQQARILIEKRWLVTLPVAL